MLKDKDQDSKMWLTTAEAASLGAEEVAARLHVDVRTGLWWQEADQRRQLVGFNELTVKEEEPTWKKYIEQVYLHSFVLFIIFFIVSRTIFLDFYEYVYSFVYMFFLQFKNPLILLLLASALVSVCMKQFDDAVSITVVNIKFINKIYISVKKIVNISLYFPYRQS